MTDLESRLIKELGQALSDNDKLVDIINKLNQSKNDTLKELGIVGSLLADLYVAINNNKTITIPGWIIGVYNTMRMQIPFSDQNDNCFIERFYEVRKEKINESELKLWKSFLNEIKERVSKKKFISKTTGE